MWAVIELAFTAVVEFVTNWFVRIVKADDR